MEDRRVRKTKDALRKSLLFLMEEKSISKITVKDLVEEADINRSTFYSYYVDVEDMVEKLQEEVIIECVEIAKKHMVEKTTEEVGLDRLSTSFIEDICYVIKKYDTLCTRMAGKNGDIMFLFKLGRVLEQNIRALFPEIHDPKYGEHPYLRQFLRGGYLSMLSYWIETNFEATPAEVAKLSDRYAKLLIPTELKIVTSI